VDKGRLPIKRAAVIATLRGRIELLEASNAACRNESERLTRALHQLIVKWEAKATNSRAAAELRLVLWHLIDEEGSPLFQDEDKAILEQRVKESPEW
jgi:hypothetical protein